MNLSEALTVYLGEGYDEYDVGAFVERALQLVEQPKQRTFTIPGYYRVETPRTPDALYHLTTDGHWERWFPDNLRWTRVPNKKEPVWTDCTVAMFK